METNSDHKNLLPPKWAELLLTHFGRKETLEEVQGDLRELFSHWVTKHGTAKAKLYYVLTILPLLNPFKRGGKKVKLDFNPSLFYSYFRLSGRNFTKNIAYSLINLSGLTAGLTASLLIFIFVRDELSYDKFLPAHENVVRIQPTVTQDGRHQTWATSEGFIVPALQAYPEVELSTRILRLDEAISFTLDSKQFKEGDAIAADDAFFDVFRLPFVCGDPTTALNRPNNVVISKEVAVRLFGNIDPVGKIIKQDTLFWKTYMVYLPGTALLPMQAWILDRYPSEVFISINGGHSQGDGKRLVGPRSVQ